MNINRDLSLKTFLISFGKRNLGLRQISSYLKQNKINVDFVFIDPSKVGSFDISGFSSEDVIGISAVTDHFPLARKLTGRIREKFDLGKPIIVIGGPHATIMPSECLEICDYVVKGEAEEAMLEICSCPQNIRSVPGICYLDGERLIENPPAALVQNLDKYPIPDNTSYGDLKDYIILASRGCPYSCAYCYNNYLMKHYRAGGQYLRKRGWASVITELKSVRESFPKLRTISFYDDTLLARSLEDLAELFGHYKSEIGLPFFCLTSPTQLTEEKLKILTGAGLKRIQIGIQTGSELVNKKIYKRFIPNSKIVQCAEYCKKYGVSVYFDVIFNNPYETAEDVGETLDLILNLPLTRHQTHLQGFNLIFYPGTEITDRAIRDGYISAKQEDQRGCLTTHWVVNSPLFFKSSLDNPLWDIHFSSMEKGHFNTLIALTPYLPKFIIKSLKKHRITVRFIGVMLKAGIWLILKTILREDNVVVNLFRKIR